MSTLNHSFEKGELSTSQKQAIITLIEKKDKDKRFITKLDTNFSYQCLH